MLVDRPHAHLLRRNSEGQQQRFRPNVRVHQTGEKRMLVGGRRCLPPVLGPTLRRPLDQLAVTHFFAPKGVYPNFWPPTLASYMSPVLVAVKIATPFS